MKRFFLAATISSIVMLFACNNETSDSTNEDITSNDSINESSSMSTGNDNNNVVSKTGIALSANQEVPVNNSTASGTADVTYNKDNKMLVYSITWTGLTANPTMAHIHGTASKGVNTGVKHDLTNKLPKTASGSFTDSVKVDGVAIKEDSLLAGFYYFNIHTPKNKGGEIRGQIEF